MRNRIALAVFVGSSLLGLSALAATPVIQRGTDAFITLGKGRTFYDFANKPIPAGFFCVGSRAFTGRIDFKGLPLVTSVPGQLRGADTIIERLDDTTLDKSGVGRTRIQFRALSLVSTTPVKTSCGDFHVYATLGGKQRVTAMNVYRTQEAGGNFVAPLAVDLKMAFIPVKPALDKGGRKLALNVAFTFPARALPWSFNAGDKAFGAVKVDTDGDLIPDTVLAGESNFSPARSPERHGSDKWGCPGCEVSCHSVGMEDEHCYIAPPPSGCPDMICDM